jgi:hypothetical protein
MSHAALPTASVLNAPALALMCSSQRKTLVELMNQSVFRGEERKRSYQNAKDCDDPAQLALWIRNVRAEAKKREDALHAACQDGTFSTGLSLD